MVASVDPVHARAAARGRLPATMSALQIQQPGVAAVVETALPEYGADEILVKVEGCGVCGSNLPIWEGRPWFQYPLPPGNPGHEAWGRVAALGREHGSSLRVGDRVAMLSYAGFAEYDVAKANAAIKLPPSLEGQPFPGEPLACALNVFARSNITSGLTVAIIGIGFLGAVLTELAVHSGAEVIAISRRPYALEVAHGLGALHTIVMDDHQRIIDQVNQITRDQGCDVVIEAVGSQWPLDLAAELTRIRGRLVIAGYHQDGPRQVNMQLWNWRGLDVINAHERDPKLYVAGMQAAVIAVASGQLNPAPLYTHRFSLSDIGSAMTQMQERPNGFLKALVEL